MPSTVKFQCVDNETPIFLIDSVSGIYNKNKRDSTNSSTGSVLLYGGLSINTTSNSSSVTNGGAFTIAGGASIEKDVYIGGNLTVLGSQTQIISQTIKVGDNLIVLNASPISGRDTGILFERYQTENDSNVGDIINDTPFLTGTVTSSTGDTVGLNNTISSDDYYNNFFIKINSQIRKITSYIGSTKTAHLNTPFTTVPNNGDLFTLYNKVYASQYYKEDTNNFVFSYTEVDPGSSNVTRGEPIGLETGFISISDTKDTVSSSNSIGSFVTLGGASIAKSMYVGNTIYSNTINITNGNILNVTASNLLSTNTITTNITTSNIIIENWKTNVSAGNLVFNHTNLSNILNLSSSGNVNIGNRLIANNASITTNITVGGNIIGNGNTSLNGNLYVNSTINTIGNIYTNGQNVGINVISPSYHLDVAGNAHITGNLTIDGTITSSALDSTTFAYLTLTSVDDAINYSTGSLIAFGGITSSSETDAESISNGGSILTKGGASIGKRLFVGNGIHAIFNSNTIGSLYTTGGNVGINTTFPQNTLDVNGSIKSNSINSLNISSSNLLVVNTTSSNLITTNATLSNLLSTNITTTNLIVNGDLSDSIFNFKNTTDWSLVSSTTGPFSLRYNNSSFITTNTNGNTIFSNNVFLNNNNYIDSNPTSVSGGCLNISGDTVVSGTNNILFTQTNSGLGAPNVASRSNGTKIVLRPEIGSNTVDYAIGVETNNLWFSSNSGIKWYKGTNVSMDLTSNGSLNITTTTNATGLGTGGSLILGGGCSIGKDLYIGGSLYVNGQNTSNISGLTTVGSFSGTSVYSIVVNIGVTMLNTTYKVVGNLTTTTSNSNTYIVSFSNLTTTTFTANILRLDSLFSGWTDSNLNLSWTVFP
jgi:hypothetical protein